MLVLQILRILCVIATILFLCQEIYLNKRARKEFASVGQKYNDTLDSELFGKFSWVALTFFWMITSVIYALG